MSLTTPTTAQLSETIKSQLEASLSQTIPFLPKAVFRVLAKVLAGVVILLYKYAGFILLQMFVRHASFAETTVNGVTFSPLIEWGRLIGEEDPSEGDASQLVLSVPVLTQVGSITKGTNYVGKNGVTYSVVSDVALNASTVSVTVIAVADQTTEDGLGIGTIGNLPNGSILSLAQPIAAVSRDATVTSTAVTGTEPESEESYRTRVINRFQRRPQGGAYADYATWCLDAEGVVSVYPYASAQPGIINLYVESTTPPDGLASPTQISSVVRFAEFDEEGVANRKPPTAGVLGFSISRGAFDVEISNLVAPDLVATQAAISAGLDEWFRAREPFIEGLSVLPRKDRLTQPEVASVASGIASSKGGSLTGLVLKKSGVILTAYTLAAGEKAKLGAASYL